MNKKFNTKISPIEQVKKEHETESSFSELNSTSLAIETKHQKLSKPKIKGCPNVQIGLGLLVSAQLVTLSFSLKFQSQIGINRSCI